MLNSISRLAAMLILTCLLGSVAYAERPIDKVGEIPQILYTTLSKHDPAYPTFVAANAAIAPDGTINEKVIHPKSVSGLRDFLDQDPGPDGCLRMEEFWWDEMGVPARESLAASARNSDLVVVGKVIGKEYGFRFREPGQLIEVEASEILRGPSRDRFLTFVPAGNFKAGPYDICKIDRRYVSPPDVGDEVVLLVPRIENENEPYVDIIDGSGLIVIQDDGLVRVPDHFKGFAGKEGTKKADIVAELRSVVPDIR